MKSIVARVCDNVNCSVVYDAEPRYLNRGQGRFCSRKCSGEANGAAKKIVHEPNVICAYCQVPFYRKKHLLTKSKSGLYFCTREHQSLAAKAESGVEYFSGPKPVNHSNGKRLCLVSDCNNTTTGSRCLFHAKEYRKQATEEKIQQWLAGNLEVTYVGSSMEPNRFIKRYLLETRGDRCEVCGFDEKHPVDGSSIITMDHIDGNYLNNLIENLKLLCPNHHALTPTFGSRNKGGGRRHRAKYYLANSWK